MADSALQPQEPEAETGCICGEGGVKLCGHLESRSILMQPNDRQEKIKNTLLCVFLLNYQIISSRVIPSPTPGAWEWGGVGSRRGKGQDVCCTDCLVHEDVWRQQHQSSWARMAASLLWLCSESRLWSRAQWTSQPSSLPQGEPLPHGAPRPQESISSAL